MAKFLDCSKPRRGQPQFSILGISTFALLGRIYIQFAKTISHSSNCALIMAYQSLLQDTIEYNRTVNLTRKVLKSKKKCLLSILPLMYKRPVQSKMPATVPVKSVMSKSFMQSIRPAPVPVKSSMSKRPGPSGKPVTVPIESGRVRKSRVVSRKAPIKPKVSLKPQTNHPKCNKALYTPMAEVREN